MSQLDIVIPLFEQFRETKGIVLQLLATAKDINQLILINNSLSISGQDDWKAFASEVISPYQKIQYIQNVDNIGVHKSLNQGYRNSETEYLGFFHTDVFVYDYGWDEKIVKYMDDNPEVGICCFYGGKICTADAQRLSCFTSLVEPFEDTFRVKEPTPVSIIDGFGFVIRRKLLEKTNGFDERYNFHHFYDFDISLESIKAGYVNVVMDINTLHVSGLSSSTQQYKDYINNRVGNDNGDITLFLENQQIFIDKWKNYLPIVVTTNGKYLLKN